MSQEINNKRLALFFTTGVGLDTWTSVGNFDREKMIYEEHLNKGTLDEVHFFTYGTDDTKLSQNLKDEKKLHEKIYVHEMPKLFSFPTGALAYSFLLPVIYRKPLREMSLYKTNQMSGAWAALLAKVLFKKKLFVRTGYTWSLFAKRQKKSFVKLFVISLVERVMYKYADIASVTSKSDKKYIQERYGEQNVEWIPNFIDTAKFYDMDQKRIQDRVVSVTRLAPQKNLKNLIKATAATGIGLDLYYGGGDMRNELESLSQSIGADVVFKGSVSNDKLPDVLNTYTYFTLPSLYEGMPKTLLEAMACGCVCLGTHVSGIEEVLQVENGFLCDSLNETGIKNGIQKMMSTDVSDIRKNSVKTIEQDYSLQAVAGLERELFTSL